MKRFYMILAVATVIVTTGLEPVVAQIPNLGNITLEMSGTAGVDKKVNPRSTYGSCCPSECPPYYTKTSSGIFGYSKTGLYVLLECTYSYTSYYTCDNYGGYMASNDSTVAASQTVLAQASEKASILINKRLARIAKS